MSDLRKAAEDLMPILDRWKMTYPPCSGADWDKVEALRTALSQPEQEPVTLLPDGSAFGVMSFPLPKSHWLYAEREYRDGEYEPIELGKPILTRELKSAVVSAVRYAIRAATNCGKEMDFDPDALVLNAVYALCGPNTAPVDAVNMSQECVDETAKRGHEPVACKHSRYSVDAHEQTGHCYDCGAEGRMKFVVDDAPPKREWVGLTDGERRDIGQGFENDNGQLAKDCALSDLRKALEKTCPPCFGDCNQGRDCPARKEKNT